MQEISLDELRALATATPTLTLSWQSLALSILLAALPTIFQPCGLGFGSLRTYHRVLRCSPLACLISIHDAISKLGAFMIMRMRLLGPAEPDMDGKAARAALSTGAGAGFDEFIKSRYPESYLDKNDSARLDLTSLRSRRLFLGLFFLFVSVPQTIKILASKGPLLKAKFACVAYAVTYILDEIVLEIATRRQGRTHPLMLSETDLRLRAISMHFIVQGMTVTAPMLFIVLRSHDHIVKYGMGGASASRPIGFGWLPLSVILVQMTILGHNIIAQREEWMRFLRDDEPKFLILGASFHLVVLVGSTMLMTGIRKMYDLRIGGILVLVGALCAFCVLRAVESTAKSRRGRYCLHVFLGTYYVLVQVAAAMLYFMHGYDESKTSRPEWTRYFDLISGLL